MGERHELAREQARLFVGIERRLRLFSPDLRKKATGQGRDGEKPTRIDRHREEPRERLRHVSPARRREVGRQSPKHLERVVERDRSEGSTSDDRIDVLREAPRVVLGGTLEPNVIREAPRELARRPLTREGLEGERGIFPGLRRRHHEAPLE